MASWGRLGLIGLVLFSSVAVAWPVSAAEAPTPELDASQPLRSAQRTQQMTRNRLRILSGGNRCADSRFVAYRRSDREPEVVDQWYVVSQLWADAMLLTDDHEKLRARPDVRLAMKSARAPEWDEREARCHVDKGFVFLDRLWDDQEGGYYPRSNPDGSKISRREQFADDNALAGLALLAAAESSDGSFSRDYYLYAAILEAEYLQESGLWDDTFGGGFWWSTGMGDSDEGKPAQTNALAALFFARLYGATGDPAHRAAALSTIGWLDAALYDEQRNLYRWSVRYERPEAKQGGPVRSERYFNYDQGIAIEAQITVAKLDGSQDRLNRARAIGDATHSAFWNRERGGYNLETGIEQVYTSYAAWTSLGHLALHAQEGDQRWLQMAQANAKALSASAGEADGSYALRYYACVDARAPGCAGGRTKWAVDRTHDTAAQAWDQHLQAALARGLAKKR